MGARTRLLADFEKAMALSRGMWSQGRRASGRSLPAPDPETLLNRPHDRLRRTSESLWDEDAFKLASQSP